MSSVTESNLGLNYGWAYGESGWNTGMDDNLVKLGFTSRNQVKGILSAPPSTPSNGDAYIVGTSPTGLFSGNFGKVAIWDRTVWLFLTPKNHEVVYNAADGCDYKYDNGWSLKQEDELSPYIKVKDFTFSTGYTIVDQKQCLLNLADNKYYQWFGALPKVVPAGSTPATSGGISAGAWVDRTDVTLRGELGETSGAAMIGGIGFTVAEAFAGANDTEILQSAVNSAIDDGHIIIKFNRDYVVSGEILNRQEVIFVGQHSITGAGSYRMRIVRGDEKSMPTLDGIVAAQLPSFSSKLNPVVVVVGDSITTQQPNSVDAVNTQYQIICDKIKADNPGRNITFYNRGIGGMGFYQLDGVAASGWPDWYTNQADPWLNYVSNLNPDLVIVSMGMNDSSDNLSLNAVESVISKIRAMPSKPDVVMVTCAVPSTNPGATYQAEYGSKAGQEGRDYAAGAIRAACVKNAVPCIDVNRVFNVVRDGFDIVDSRSKILTGATASGGGYLSPIECRNWSAVVGLSGRAAYTGTDPIAVKVGPKSTEVCFIKINGSFQLVIECYNAPHSNYVTYTLANQVVPDAAHQLQIEVLNQKIRAFVVGSTVDSKPDFKNLYVGGGLYFPGIGKYDAIYGSGTLSSVDQFAYGEHTIYMPSVTNTEAWGTGDNSGTTKSPYGGNGINHPSSIGAQAVWGVALAACDFSCQVDGIFSHNQGGGYEVRNGKIIRMWGRKLAPSVGAQVDSSVTWPVDVSGALSYSMVVSGGINSPTLDATLRSSQTIITVGTPTGIGFDITWHCPVQSSLGRYVDWKLDIVW